MDAAVIAFPHVEGAEHEYASARARASRAPWLPKVAFVEVHHRGRIVVRGTVAGHYVDTDDDGDLMGRDTAVGAIIGVIVGLALGPPGWAAGLVAGGALGGLHNANHVPARRGPVFDEIRDDVPANSSAVLVVAEPDEVDRMVSAFAETRGRLRRYHLSPDAYSELETAVASSPAAAPPQPARGARWR